MENITISSNPYDQYSYEELKNFLNRPKNPEIPQTEKETIRDLDVQLEISNRTIKLLQASQNESIKTMQDACERLENFNKLSNKRGYVQLFINCAFAWTLSYIIANKVASVTFPYFLKE